MWRVEDRPDWARRSGPLSAEELEVSKNHVREVQRRAFTRKVAAMKRGAPISATSRLLPLSPVLDEDGLLRVGGRLGNAPLPEAVRHPIVLPRDNRVTHLIVMDTHQKLLHAEVEQTLNEMRQTFWIPRGRASVKKVVHDCSVYRRRRVKPYQPRMADLPQARFDTGHVFSSVGLDFFGPLIIETG